VLRPNIETLKIIQDLKSEWRSFKDKSEIRFMFVPRRTFECDKFIQDNNLIDVNDFKNDDNKMKVEQKIT